MTTLISGAQDVYAQHLEKEFGSPKGSNEKRIEACEKMLGYRFPKSYREYLTWMGDDKGGIFRGSEWFLDDVMSNTRLLPELLHDNNVTFEHEGTAVCFFSHQGYMAAWFYLPAKKDDPECYFFSEVMSPARVESTGTFSEFLVEELMGPVRRRLA